MASVVTALAGLCAATAVALRDACAQVAFAVLSGNGDLHAKNMSVVNIDGEWFTSPAYDLTCTLPYGDTTLALPLTGKRRDIFRSTLLDFAESLGLRRQVAKAALNELLARTEGTEELIRDGALPFDQGRIRQTVSGIGRRLLTRGF